MASIVIHEAPAEVVQQAQHILESHHEHLLEARILFLFSNAKATSRGKVLAGKGKKLTPEQRFLSSYRGALIYDNSSVEEGYDFIVTICEHQWHDLLKTQRAALLDHLLCWCDRKERINRRTGAVTYSWAMRGPDVEEFSEIVERHGLWQPSIKRFVQRADLSKQLELPPDQVVDVKVPVERTTTVDGDGTVVETKVEEAGPDGNGSGAYPLDPRSVPEVIADLDRRDAELERKQADASIPGNWREITGVGRTARARRS